MPGPILSVSQLSWMHNMNLAFKNLDSSLWFLKNPALKRICFWPLSNANARSLSGTLQRGHYQPANNNYSKDGRVRATTQFCWSKAHWLYVCYDIIQIVQGAWKSVCLWLSVSSFPTSHIHLWNISVLKPFLKWPPTLSLNFKVKLQGNPQKQLAWAHRCSQSLDQQPENLHGPDIDPLHILWQLCSLAYFWSPNSWE